MRLVGVSCLLLALSCGSRDRSCTIVQSEGVTTLECPDGTSWVLDDGEAPDAVVTRVSGDYVVADETDLAAIAHVTTITGSLIIRDSAIDTLIPLPLELVGGDLVVERAPYLRDLAGLAALRSIGGDILIADVDALVDLEGLIGVEEVGTRITVQSAPRITSLEGLGGADQLEVLTLRNLPGLTSLAGLDGLSILGELVIDDAPRLDSLEGMTGLGLVNALTLVECPLLGSLAPIEGRFSGWGPAILRGLGISDLTGLGGLEVLTALQLDGDEALTDLTALAGLATVEGTLAIRGCPALPDLDGLDALTTVQGSLILVDNASLASLSALDALTSVVAQPVVTGNAVCQVEIDAFVVRFPTCFCAGTSCP